MALTNQDRAFMDAKRAQGASFDEAWAALQKQKGGGTPAPQKQSFGQMVSSQFEGARNDPFAGPVIGAVKKATKTGLGLAAQAFEAAPGILGAGLKPATDKIAQGIREDMPALENETLPEKIGGTGLDIGVAALTGGAGRALGVGASEMGVAGASRGLTQLPKIVQKISGLRTTGQLLEKALPVAGESVAGTTAFTETSQQRIPKPAELALGVFADLTAVPLALSAVQKGLKIVEGTPAGQKVAELFEKAIRPSVAGKKNLPEYKTYLGKAGNAIETIVENKPALRFTTDSGEVVKGKLPENLKEFSDSIDQTKEVIFAKYDQLAKESGEAGTILDVEDITAQLRSVGGNKIQRTFAPSVVQYADDLANRIESEGALSPLEAQQAIQFLNKKLESFYRNPTQEGVATSFVDALLANNLRNKLDAAIESTGEGYQALKNQYGALKTIEKDVLRRAIVDARKAPYGLIDFSDIFSAGDIVRGLASFDPVSVTKGAGQMAIKSYLKMLNDPNRMIRNLFNEAEKAISEGVETSLSQGAKQIVPPKDFNTAGTAKSATIFRGGTSEGKYFSTSKTVAADFAKNRGGSVSEYTLSPNAKVINYEDIPTAQYKGINDYNMEKYGSGEDLLSFQNGKLEVDYAKAETWARGNGYDAVKFPTEGEVRVINDKAVGAPTQTKDIPKQ